MVSPSRMPQKDICNHRHLQLVYSVCEFKAWAMRSIFSLRQSGLQAIKSSHRTCRARRGMQLSGNARMATEVAANKSQRPADNGAFRSLSRRDILSCQPRIHSAGRCPARGRTRGPPCRRTTSLSAGILEGAIEGLSASATLGRGSEPPGAMSDELLRASQSVQKSEPELF